VARNAPINALVEKWAKRGSLASDGYLFDILDEADQPEAAQLKVQLFIHFVN
jgi:hypothetical protein